jgi:hypothetical protein
VVFEYLHVVARGLKPVNKNKQVSVFYREVLMNLSEKLLVVVVNLFYYDGLSSLFGWICHPHLLLFREDCDQRLNFWLLRYVESPVVSQNDASLNL